jgi:hypothetical protein
VTSNNYATISTFFVPGVTGNPLIQLGSIGAQTIKMPDWNYEVNDISWAIAPTNATIFNVTNVTFQISAAHSDLQYFGLIVSRMNYSNLTQICSQNISASPGGGILYCNINVTGNYQIQPFWRVQGYATRLPFARTIIYSNGTSWSNAMHVFQDNQPIGPWGFYAIGLIIAMIAGGWVSKYSIDGAGLAVCAVLWFFTFFNPSSCLATVTSGMCITPMIVTTFTTVATVAALYLVKYL